MSENNFALSLQIPDEAESGNHVFPNNGTAADQFQPLSLNLGGLEQPLSLNLSSLDQPLSLNLGGLEQPNELPRDNMLAHSLRDLNNIREEFKGFEEEDEDHGDDHILSKVSYENPTCFERIKKTKVPQISFNFPQGTLTLDGPDFDR